MKRIFIVFGAGCLGGLVNSIVVWWFGNAGLTEAMGVSISPSFNPEWLYPRIVWGGIWGLTFLLPIYKSRMFLKGSFLSLFPTAVILFVVYPFKLHKGILGYKLGLWTPVFVLLFNWIWGVVSALAIKLSK